jgi:hypothetical protein
MPRKPRFFLPDVPVHMEIRGNSRQVIFAEADDYPLILAGSRKRHSPTTTKSMPIF